MTVQSRIYEEALRLIESQQDELDALRARVGTLLAAASLITTFLGTQALGHTQSVRIVGGHELVETQFGTLEWLAVALFVAAAICSLAVFWPWTWYFGLSPRILIEDHVEAGQPDRPESFELYLARVHERNWERNARTLERLAWPFRTATLCVVGEVVVWVISLGTS